MKQYTFSYWFKGSKWSFELWADSPTEALQKFEQLKTATYDGEIAFTVTVPSFFERFVLFWCRWRDQLR